jgi:hypothetical protein
VFQPGVGAATRLRVSSGVSHLVVRDARSQVRAQRGNGDAAVGDLSRLLAASNRAAR